MEILGLLGIGAAFLLFMSLLTGSGSATDRRTPEQVVYIGTPPEYSAQTGGSGIGLLIAFTVLLFFLWMMLTP